MKKIILPMLSLIFALGCSTARYFPKEFDEKVEFGMILGSFERLKNDRVSKQDDGMPFRHVYLEEVTALPFEFIGYYFDDDNNKPLYEVIISYKDIKVRDQVARDLFGSPNAENNSEWHLKPKNGPEIKAWTHKQKLVIVALIPETEWHPDENS